MRLSTSTDRKRVPLVVVAIGLASVFAMALSVAVLLSPHYLAEELARYQTERQASTWQARTLMMLQNPEQTFAQSSMTEQDDGALRHFIVASDTYRVVLFNADGVAFWSTNASKIGSKIEGEYFREIIQYGGLYHKTEKKRPDEIDDFWAEASDPGAQSRTERHVSEIYVPVFVRGKFWVRWNTIGTTPIWF